MVKYWLCTHPTPGFHSNPANGLKLLSYIFITRSPALPFTPYSTRRFTCEYEELWGRLRIEECNATPMTF
ncbi:hypothetical protein M758_UG196000 [Ceratodon purpureus]|nr:hypothetical protein M758_UG196000 [Ceratodon purpureus]